MWDPTIYPEPEKFDGYRFLKRSQIQGHEKDSQFAATSVDHMGFGYGTQACPGRFFAVDVIKIVFSHILLKYDWKLPEGYKPQVFKIGIRLLADPKVKLLMRRRQEEIPIWIASGALLVSAGVSLILTMCFWVLSVVIIWNHGLAEMRSNKISIPWRVWIVCTYMARRPPQFIRMIPIVSTWYIICQYLGTMSSSDVRSEALSSVSSDPLQRRKAFFLKRSTTRAQCSSAYSLHQPQFSKGFLRTLLWLIRTTDSRRVEHVVLVYPLQRLELYRPWNLVCTTWFSMIIQWSIGLKFQSNDSNSELSSKPKSATGYRFSLWAFKSRRRRGRFQQGTHRINSEVKSLWVT